MGTMSDTHPHSLFHVAKLPCGSFQVLDGLMRTHRASNEVELGKLLAELIQDPDIPRPEMAPPRNDFVRAGTRLLSRVFPQFGRLITAAEPLVEEGIAMRKVRTTGPRKRQRMGSSRGGD
jgi:hypothetical protein